MDFDEPPRRKPGASGGMKDKTNGGKDGKGKSKGGKGKGWLGVGKWDVKEGATAASSKAGAGDDKEKNKEGKEAAPAPAANAVPEEPEPEPEPLRLLECGHVFHVRFPFLFLASLSFIMPSNHSLFNRSLNLTSLCFP